MVDMVYKKTSIYWQQVPGWLRDISVGKNSVWGVNRFNNIYKRVGSGYWEHVQGKLKQVSVSGLSDLAVWGIGPTDEVLRWQGGNSWEGVGGTPQHLKVVSVGEAGVWGVGRDHRVWYRNDTYGGQASLGSGWQEVDGNLAWISSGSRGEVWGTDEQGNVFKREGVNQNNPAGSTWQQVTGKMVQVSVWGKQVWGVKRNTKIFFAEIARTQKWPGLRTNFGIPPFSGFNKQPRTMAEAEDSGWQRISSCNDGGNFLGNRYIETSGNSFILIFDNAGYIAGTQSVVLKSYVDYKVVDVFNHPAYQLDYLGAEKGYFTTAYFVDPAVICNKGRTEEDFARDGTGDRLLIQVGESHNMLARIPDFEKEALAQDGWYEHKCFPGMGKHVIGFNYQHDQPCEDVMPVQILYHKGRLSGFVWQHMARIPQNQRGNTMWEYPFSLVIPLFIDSPPKCLIEGSKSPGLSAMHHYFLDKPWFSFC